MIDRRARSAAPFNPDKIVIWQIFIFLVLKPDYPGKTKN